MRGQIRTSAAIMLKPFGQDTAQFPMFKVLKLPPRDRLANSPECVRLIAVYRGAKGCEFMEKDDPSKLIFAEIRYAGNYRDVHSDLVRLLEGYFSNIQSGLQGDSWIWITDGDDKVEIDTFSSMTHEVKSYAAGPLVQKVINALRIKYDVQVFDEPFEMWG